MATRVTSTARSTTVLAATVLFALCMIFAGQVPAQAATTASAPEESPWTLGLAVGQGRRSNPFVASDDVDIPVVLDIAWYGERWFFDNGDLGYSLHQSAVMSLGGIVTFNNERNYFSFLSDGSSGLDILDLRRLAASSISSIAGSTPNLDSLSSAELEALVFQDQDSSLPERDFAVNAGLDWVYLTTWGDWQAQLTTDISNTHKGESAWLSYSYPWIWPKAELNLSLGLEWKSADLVDYYYGVSASEALPGRSQYQAGDTVNQVLRLSGVYSLTPRWKLTAVAEREYLGSAIRRSPIIRDRWSDTLFVGFYYQFK